MYSEIAIRVQGLRKQYQIYANPGDRLKQFILPRMSRILGARRVPQYFKEFWAVNDVSFEVRKGETLGIIGRNGSGKSTLLQLICGTLTPTQGEVHTYGRIAALLELGSGFNPEFTGRENVFFNAAVLGLTPEETSERFDQIAAFADIGDFMDQPVKTYSSGMMVRLAFAVIAHVDADILVVDEALAVGDAIFTQKCMRFIRQFRKNGTLLFVSHDMGSVLNLCQSAVWLDGGCVRSFGPSKAVSEEYLAYTAQEIYGQEAKVQTLGDSAASPVQRPESTVGVQVLKSEPAGQAETASAAWHYHSEVSVQNNLSEANGWKTGMGEVTHVSLDKTLEDGLATFQGGEAVVLTVTAVTHAPMTQPILGFLLKDRLGQDLLGENTLYVTKNAPVVLQAGDQVQAKFSFVLPMLRNGDYAIMCSFAEGDLVNNVQHHYLHDALMIHVNSSTVRWGLVGVKFSNVTIGKTT